MGVVCKADPTCRFGLANKSCRSLLYYIFLATATIFSHIIRDTRNAQTQEDLQSLNMAATFFATLSHPGDGPAHYAGFMTRMSANLERIARLAIEKEEKRARSPDDGDQESHQPGAKRHNHRSSRSHAKTRHQPSTLRTSTTTDSTRSDHPSTSTAPHVSNASTASYPRMSALSIPEAIDGLPPVNSEGYVVPLSPSVTNPFPSSIPSQPTIPPANYPPGLGLQNLNDTPTTDFPSNTLPTWQLGLDTTAQTTDSSPLESTQSPFSTSSTTPGTTMFPASWQVPLTADWQFGDNFWSGLFPTETIAASAQAENVQLPTLSAESFLNVPAETELDMSAAETGHTGVGMGYNNYMPPRAVQDQGMGQDTAEMIWPDGFLGLF